MINKLCPKHNFNFKDFMKQKELFNNVNWWEVRSTQEELREQKEREDDNSPSHIMCDICRKHLKKIRAKSLEKVIEKYCEYCAMNCVEKLKYTPVEEQENEY